MDPGGSNYPIFKAFGPKHHRGYGSGTRVLKYCVLGPSGDMIGVLQDANVGRETQKV